MVVFASSVKSGDFIPTRQRYRMNRSLVQALMVPALVAITLYLLLGCCTFMSRKSMERSMGKMGREDELDLTQAGISTVLSRKHSGSVNEAGSGSILGAVLDKLVHTAGNRYKPLKHTELDLTEFAQHARELQDLWALDQEYAKLKQTKSVVGDRTVLLGAIDRLGSILYPWLTGNGTISSVLSVATHATRDRGIVLPTGKGQIRVATHLLAILRHYHHSTLPVEVIYYGEGDLSPEQRQFLESIGPDIKCVDIQGMFEDKYDELGLPGGWAVRAFAILASSFRHAMLLDADAVLLLDPERFFDEPGYSDTGTLFWHDRMLGPTGNDKYDWVDGMLERLGVDNYERLKKGSEWFTRKNGHELER
jgi:hypothetical protein